MLVLEEKEHYIVTQRQSRLSTVHRELCKYFLDSPLVQSQRSQFTVFSFSQQPVLELLPTLPGPHLPLVCARSPALCRPHLALVGSTSWGSGDLFKKLPPQNEVMNSSLFSNMKSQEL